MKRVITAVVLLLLIFANCEAKNKKRAAKKAKARVEKSYPRREIRSYVVKLLADEAGRVLYEENGRMSYPIASLTKMMTILVTMEKIESGELSYNDVVKISPKSDDTAGISSGLVRGEEYKLEDLMKTAVAHSSNDAAYAIAEYVGMGNVDEFVKLMNKKAEELGMKDTVYYTPTGLPKHNTGKGVDVSTAEDMAKLASVIVKHEKYYEFSAAKSITITELKSGKKSTFRNTNKMVGSYEGLDGLKTGFHNAAMFNIVATAKRGKLRFIAVVFGSDSQQLRAKEVEELLDAGFMNYESVKVADKKKQLATIKFDNNKKKAKIYSEFDEYIAVKKDEKRKIKKKLYLPEKVDELKENEKVGVLSVFLNGKEVAQSYVVARDIEKKENFFIWLFHLITFNIFR